MSKTVTFHFAREHYLGDQRHPANSEATLAEPVARQLEKALVGKIVGQDKPARSGKGFGKKD